MMDQQLLKRIVSDPKIMVGKPVIRGTRIPVELIVRMVAQGMSRQEILADYPSLEPEDIQAALYYAAATVAQEDIYSFELEAVAS